MTSITAPPPTPIRVGSSGDVQVRLALPHERLRWDELMRAHHFLGFKQFAGRGLRYIAEYRGQWVALLGWQTGAFLCGPRDRWVGWSKDLQFQRLLAGRVGPRSGNGLMLSRELCGVRLESPYRATFLADFTPHNSWASPVRGPRAKRGSPYPPAMRPSRPLRKGWGGPAARLRVSPRGRPPDSDRSWRYRHARATG